MPDQSDNLNGFQQFVLISTACVVMLIFIYCYIAYFPTGDCHLNPEQFNNIISPIGSLLAGIGTSALALVAYIKLPGELSKQRKSRELDRKEEVKKRKSKYLFKRFETLERLVGFIEVIQYIANPMSSTSEGEDQYEVLSK